MPVLNCSVILFGAVSAFPNDSKIAVFHVRRHD
jgi:hypothetical protein